MYVFIYTPRTDQPGPDYHNCFGKEVIILRNYTRFNRAHRGAREINISDEL